MSRTKNRRRLGKTVDTGDMSSGGLLNRQQFDEFFQEVQDQTVLLDRVRFAPMAAHQTQIDKIGVGTRLLRAASEGSAGTLVEANWDSIDMDVSKVELPFEITEEVVEDSIEQENTARILVQKFAQQFGVDLEDLGINGDETSTDAFLQIEDGWLQIAADRVVADQTYDHSNAGINKDVFHELVSDMPSKFLRTQNNVFLMSTTQKQAFKDYLTDRSTGAGDAMLMTGEEPTPYGYPVLDPPTWPDDEILFTNPQNLIYGARRDMKVRFTDEGEAVVTRDLYGIWNILARIDFQIEDEDGVTRAHNIAAP